MGQSSRPGRLRAALSHAWIAVAVVAAPRAHAGSVGGDISATSDYIFRGISLSDGQATAQIDLHATSSGGNFIGVFGSTLDRNRGRGTEFELETYLGHRFDLSPIWSSTLTAVNYSYLNGRQANDYQELSASVSYLDRWTLSVTAAPNIVRYYEHFRLGRYAAYVADAAGQLPLVGRLFMTGGAGYYSLTGPGGAGYAYGNAGLAFEYRAWRIDAGYYFAEKIPHELFPWGTAGNRLAATLSWHF